jgi:hypothetical protein
MADFGDFALGFLGGGVEGIDRRITTDRLADEQFAREMTMEEFRAEKRAALQRMTLDMTNEFAIDAENRLTTRQDEIFKRDQALLTDIEHQTNVATAAAVAGSAAEETKFNVEKDLRDRMLEEALVNADKQHERAIKNVQSMAKKYPDLVTTEITEQAILSIYGASNPNPDQISIGMGVSGLKSHGATKLIELQGSLRERLSSEVRSMFPPEVAEGILTQLGSGDVEQMLSTMAGALSGKDPGLLPTITPEMRESYQERISYMRDTYRGLVNASNILKKVNKDTIETAGMPAVRDFDSQLQLFTSAIGGSGAPLASPTPTPPVASEASAPVATGGGLLSPGAPAPAEPPAEDIVAQLQSDIQQAVVGSGGGLGPQEMQEVISRAVDMLIAKEGAPSAQRAALIDSMTAVFLPEQG